RMHWTQISENAVAEHERTAISERTRAALQAAKHRGVKLGGPRLAAARKASIKVRSEAADAFAANVRPVIKETYSNPASAEMEQHGRFQQASSLARSTAWWPSTAGGAVLLHCA